MAIWCSHAPTRFTSANIKLGQDHEGAVKWFRKAAEQGHAVAQARLGDKYRDGKG